MRWKKSERDFLRGQRVVRLATAGASRIPHNVPVCHVFSGGKVYFASAADAAKVRNIRENSTVAIVADEYSERWARLRGIMLQGSARLIEGGAEFRRLRGLLYKKYPQYPKDAPLEEGESVVVEVTPSNKFSWGL